MSSCVRRTRLLVVVLTLRPLLLVFGIYLTDLFKDPTTYVGMIGWFIGGAVDLTWTIQYSVQARWALIVSFIWLLPLTELGATKAGVDRRVISIVTVVSTLVSVASGLAVAISGFRSARFACIIIATG